MAKRRGQQQAKKAFTARRIVGIEDMVLLEDVRDAGICENLKARLQQEQIYTFIGQVLVACNPYKWLPIYEHEVMKQYVHMSRVDVTPHIFATAEAAFRGMVTEEDNQCVIISGESGAGKTEASKQIQSYIATVSGGGESVEKIKKVFLESNPLLESFGNAKTLRNNNSSRFGKYFELKFTRFGTPQGGLITNYLLEKSRIVRPGNQERNFHIFYQLIASKYASNMGLGPASSYSYLNCSGCYSVDGVNDSQDFEETFNAMKCMGMTNNQMRSVLSLVAAVLHLGNIQFRSQQVGDSEGCSLSDPASLSTFCEMLKLDQENLLQVLTFRTLTTMAPGGKTDTYQVPQNPVQAAARRDAISKALYERLFDLIVSTINRALDPERQEGAVPGIDSSELLTIGVLDIYGFEVFTVNNFEQLCINYVNERLQQIFIELTLRAEQEEYEREGIAWKPIPFFNNRVVCELLDGAKPPGLFRLLDDTCKAMHGTKQAMDVDRKFLETCGQQHGSNAHFHSSSSNFTIKHYAGDVSYALGKFGEANKDALVNDLKLVLKNSGDKMMQFLFQEEIDPNDKKQPPTAGYRIRTQAQDLVTTLMECQPHYVRCIKSNDDKQPLTVNQTRVTHQIKYLGLSENIKVRRAGFAYRADYHRFLDRFNILSPQTYPDFRGTDKEGCRIVVKAIAAVLPGITKEEIQLGNSKIFVRQPETYFAIERLRESRIGDFVARVQRCWRKYNGRKLFIRMQNGMSKMYSKENKVRRRDSIFRPFDADYLMCAGTADRVSAIRDALYRIIDFYNPEENIVFIDTNSHLLSRPLRFSLSRSMMGSISGTASAGEGFSADQVTTILTDEAVYLIQLATPQLWSEELAARNITEPKALPALCGAWLRRRIPLARNQEGGLQSLALSKSADGCVVLKVKEQQIRSGPGGVGIKTHWKKNEDVSVCPLTGKPFTMTKRRHHCRGCGDIYRQEVCNFSVMLPDIGWTTPEVICDNCIGLRNLHPAEDLLVSLPRKTELVAFLMTEWRKTNNDSPLTVSFLPSIPLRAVSGDGSLSRTPAETVEFREDPSTPLEGVRAELGQLSGARYNRIIIKAPRGLTQEVVEERQKRQIQRQKKAEVRRKRAEQERQELRREKEAEREAQRKVMLAEKKARKAAEKERRRAQAQQSTGGAESTLAAMRGSSKISRSSLSSPSNTTPPPPPPVPGPGGLKKTSSKFGPSSADAPPPPPNPLAAALAKRRNVVDC